MNAPARPLTDEASFLRLYDETAPRVYGLVLRVVRDPVVAEEVTREVYLRAWAGAHPDDRPATIAGLMISAHRHAVDTVRGPEPTPPTAPASIPPRRTVETAASPASVRSRRALHQLPDAEREAVELAYFGGYTHAEVGVLVGARTGRAQVLIVDGLRRLRTTLLEPA